MSELLKINRTSMITMNQLFLANHNIPEVRLKGPVKVSLFLVRTHLVVVMPTKSPLRVSVKLDLWQLKDLNESMQLSEH